MHFLVHVYKYLYYICVYIYIHLFSKDTFLEEELFCHRECKG